MDHTEPLDHHDLAVAARIHAILVLAYAQESHLLQIADTTSQQTPEGIRHSGLVYIGAQRGDQLLGWVSLGPDDEPRQISVALLVVHPAHQRQGIARALLRHVLRQAQGTVLSVVAAAGNLPALALYRQLGFAEYRRGTLGPEAIEVIKLRTAPLESPETQHGDPNRNH